MKTFRPTNFLPPRCALRQMSPRLELYQHVAITHYLYYFIQDRYQERKTARYTIIIYSDTSFPTCYSKQNIRRERV